MALSRQQLLDHPNLLACVKRQSASLLALFDHEAHLAAVFATQQRWLMSHAGLALHFRAERGNPRSGLHLTAFLDAVQRHHIASRNTAENYIKEMVKYKYVTMSPPVADRRMKPMEPAPLVIEALGMWIRIHLDSLDQLTGGNRLAEFEANPGLIARLQPPIADALIAARTVRQPTGTFSLFTWLDNGGLIMDWLITSMEIAPPDIERIAVGATVSVSEMAARLNLSRTHLSRKLKEAEDMGSIGWTGRRGHSPMWISSAFRCEYLQAQAIKLEIFDQAWEAIRAHGKPEGH